MLCVAICRDVERGVGQRSALFEAHVAHNLSHLGRFLFTGPTASDDGASGVGDDARLVGSLYCLDVDRFDSARAIMEADPFMQGAWKQIDYYDWRGPAGIWSDDEMRPKGLAPDYRCYAAASHGEMSVDAALMHGRVTALGSSAIAAPPFSSLALLRSKSIVQARARCPGADWVVAVPIAIGSWVGISSRDDLPAR